jgi:hypothetical protein
MMPFTCTRAQSLPEILHTRSAMRFISGACECQLTVLKGDQSC